MAFRDTWHRTLVYFGLAEDDAYDDDELEPYAEPEAELQDSYHQRQTVRRLSSRRRRDEFDDIFADDAEPTARTASLRAVGGRGNGRSGGDVRVHFVEPKNFNDVQDVADKFKEAIPVILNLQGTDNDLSKRLIDFSSGLTYALDGGMQRVADKVFLLTPRNVEVSAEQRARL
jgi:cell division inhibitor SepF